MQPGQVWPDLATLGNSRHLVCVSAEGLESSLV